MLTDFHLPGGAIGQKNNPGWDLLGKAQHIGGIGPVGLKANGIAPHQSAGDGVGRRRNGTEYGVLHGIIIKTPSKLANDTRLLEAA